MDVAIIKFFGSLAAIRHQDLDLLDQRYGLMARVGKALNGRDQVCSEAIVALGNIGSSEKGLDLISKSDCLETFSSMFYTASDHLLCIKSTACFFQIE